MLVTRHRDIQMRNLVSPRKMTISSSQKKAKPKADSQISPPGTIACDKRGGVACGITGHCWKGEKKTPCEWKWAAPSSRTPHAWVLGAPYP